MRTLIRGIRQRNDVVGGNTSRLGLAVLCIVMVVVVHLITGNFATLGNATTTLSNGAWTLIIAITGAFLLISGNIDLSVGGMYSCMLVFSAVMARNSGNFWVGLLSALGLGLVFGLLNGWLVRAFKINPLIVTIGTGFVFQGIAYLLAGGTTIFGVPQDVTLFGGAKLAGVSVMIWISIAIFVAGSVLLKRSVFGIRTYAIGGNPIACVRNGINVTRHVILLYALSGLSVGVVGFLTMAQLASGDPNTGATFQLDVLTAILLGGVGFQGGTGRPVGLFLGVLTLQIINGAMVFLGFPFQAQLIAKGLVLVGALAFDRFREQQTERRERRSARNRNGSVDSDDHLSEDQPSVDQSSTQNLGGVEEGRGNLAPVPVQVGSATPGSEVIFECQGLGKRYGPVFANRDISFRVRSGKITCILGDNGAGKSTLIKMISGAEKPDAGTLHLGGEPVHFDDPAAARAAGIRTVYQDLALCGNLGAVVNLTLGEEPAKGPKFCGPLRWFDIRAAARSARIRAEALGIEIDSRYRPLEQMSGGQRQAVAVARALEPGARLVIFDEPTAALGVRESAAVLSVIRSVAQTGAGVILISHDISTVLSIADDFVVLHLGEQLFESPRSSVDESQLVSLMSGVVPASLQTSHSSSSHRS